jgi:hypothetical protein
VEIFLDFKTVSCHNRRTLLLPEERRIGRPFFDVPALSFL